jgi:hypothetical protein
MSEAQRQGNEEELVAGVRRMYQELYAWREEHPEAGLDEIAGQVTPRRRELVRVLLERLAQQHGTGMVAEGVTCERCGQPMRYKGEAKRGVIHYLEGEMGVERAYYHCERCNSGIFPPGRATEVGAV